MMFCMIFQKGLLTWVYPRSCQRCHFYSTDYTSLAELWCPSHSRWFNHCHKVMNITAQEIKLYFYIVLTTLQNPSLQSNTLRQIDRIYQLNLHSTIFRVHYHVQVFSFQEASQSNANLSKNEATQSFPKRTIPTPMFHFTLFKIRT